MRGLRLYAGNRLEILAQKLAENLNVPLSSPFEKEIIVVQSRGMERWLSMQLARNHGVCSNYTFPFPTTMMEYLFHLVLDDFPGSSIFEGDILAWRIMDVLPGLLDGDGFESLRAYLKDDPKEVRLYQLSCCLSEIFDSYCIFRPDMVLGWQEGSLSMPGSAANLESWQSRLWKAVSREYEQGHMASLREKFISSLSREKAALLPERISLFGISYIPRFYLEVFHKVSSFIPVDFYLLNPCRQYWGDIRSGSEIARMSILYGEAARELYLEEGNSLLAAMGMVGRDLFDVLQDFEPREVDAFEDAPSGTLLGRIQADILDLVNTGPQDESTIQASDNSIQIHSCHSPMREIEVLRDNLLALFDDDPSLKPEDIVVMSPSLELYAPFIQAVFDVQRNSPDYIPFTVADRSLKTASTLADIILNILDLSMSRFEASRVVSLLEHEPVRKRFGLSESDLDTIQRWIRESGIRWGLDALWKQKYGLPDIHENTWGFGLDRLVLGYAMIPEGDASFESILPCGDIEGESPQILGSLLSFLSALFARVRSFSTVHTLDEWSGILAAILDEFFLIDEDLVSQAGMIRSIFSRLSETRELTGFGRRLSLEVIRTCLMETFGTMEEGKNFLSGGITFCAMMPMRSIPFKVVCMLGMNHADFPRQQRAKGFDLIGHAPRRGDCNLRNKDLYLFLEAVLSARKVLYISYIGQNMQDNSPIPPSVPVSILLDYIDERFRTPEGCPAAASILSRHCLQAFNPRYFTGSDSLFSYSAENASAAGILVLNHKRERLFIQDALRTPGDEWNTVDMNMLCEFFRNPSRFLLRRRLMMALPSSLPPLEDLEPIELSDLELYMLKTGHIRRILEGKGADASYDSIRMSGALPHGIPGEVLFERIRSESDPFIRTVKGYISDSAPLNRMIELPLGAYTITGSLKTYGPGKVVLYRPAGMKAADLFTAWIHHLMLCSMPSDIPCRTFCVARDRTAEFLPVENFREILLCLLDYFRQGIMQPLPFFPGTSLAFAQALAKGGADAMEEALRKACQAWEGTPYRPGESGDYSYGICFRGANPLDAGFEQAAAALFKPLLEHMRDNRS